MASTKCGTIPAAGYPIHQRPALRCAGYNVWNPELRREKGQIGRDSALIARKKGIRRASGVRGIVFWVNV